MKPRKTQRATPKLKQSTDSIYILAVATAPQFFVCVSLFLYLPGMGLVVIISGGFPWMEQALALSSSEDTGAVKSIDSLFEWAQRQNFLLTSLSKNNIQHYNISHTSTFHTRTPNHSVKLQNKIYILHNLHNLHNFSTINNYHKIF